MDALNKVNIPVNQWKNRTYSYLAAISTTLILKFTFEAASRHDWYLDDVSVKDPLSTEMLINNDFESSPSLTGWTIGYNSSCVSICGISNTQAHSLSKAYYTSCDSKTTWISQSFAAIGGQVYTITFWIYLEYSNGGGADAPTVVVKMN